MIRHWPELETKDAVMEEQVASKMVYLSKTKKIASGKNNV